MNANAMFKLTYGLYVLTTREGDRDNGCIINTPMQVTSTPNRISVAVNKANYTNDLILKSHVLNISALTETVSFDTFKNFGFQSGKTVDKFADFKDVARSENGLYYVSANAAAYISAKVINEIDLGTHTLYIADVTDCDVLSDGQPVTYDYYQKHIKQAPPKPKVGGWRCKICGYVYEGETLPPDFVCPTCKHGAADFEYVSA